MVTDRFVDTPETFPTFPTKIPDHHQYRKVRMQYYATHPF